MSAWSLYLLAIGLALSAWLVARPLLKALEPSDPRAAEACLWLGVIGSRIGHSFWLSDSDPGQALSSRPTQLATIRRTCSARSRA